MKEISSAGSDPRQPSTAKPYVPPPISQQDLPIDYSGFLAVVLGVSGVMFRHLRTGYARARCSRVAFGRIQTGFACLRMGFARA
ncbi:Protein Asterix [Platanthera zijinensis]|uniref:Protein Asterix n=1 Tax=Platanthera zijinensis TaxID=2320716 RepID=A0AAP0C061_9ASPA